MKIKNYFSSLNLLFCFLVVLHTAITLYLIFSHRLPATHDGFQYFSQQYYFLNNLVASGEFPQWIPYMTQGTVAAWWYSLQASIFQSALIFFASLLKHINFLTIYNIGIFVDQLVLLTGTWLLAQRFFESKATVFFVTATVMSTTIWMSQPWWNFHFYYALPLILHFGHLFFETGRWRYFFLSGNLLAIQTLGNLPYFISVTSLVIFLYFLFYMLFNFQNISFHRIRFGLNSLAAMIGVGVFLKIAYHLLQAETELIVNYNFGRLPDGSVSLSTFLTYAGNTSLLKWQEIFSGISPALDYTLFLGFLPLPLIVLGITIYMRKKYLHFFLLTAILLLFSKGTFISVFFYNFWPLMKFYRHLSLVSPIIKLFLCFLAGIGFEALFVKSQIKRDDTVFSQNLQERAARHLNVIIFLTAAILFGLSISLFNLSYQSESAYQWIHSLVSYELPNLLEVINDPVIQNRLVISFSYALLTYILIGLLPILNLNKYRLLIISLALGLHMLNIYEYHLNEMNLRTTPLNKSEYSLTSFQDIPFQKKREASFWNNNTRASIISHLPTSTVIYWSTHPFLFKDQVGNPFRTDHWLMPLDRFMRAYWGQSIDDMSSGTIGGTGFNLVFPSHHPAAQKFGGVTEDKIQFFKTACPFASDDKIASCIRSPNYKGDMLFVSSDMHTAISTPDSTVINLGLDTRLLIPYTIKKFNANHLELDVDVLNADPVWMVYSDVWHPQWKATVNGEPAVLLKANLAYKAVQLKKGLNKVHFFFKSPSINFLHYVIGANAFFWLGVAGWLTKRIFLNQENREPAAESDEF